MTGERNKKGDTGAGIGSAVQHASSKHNLKQLMNTLKNPITDPDQLREIQQILKTNPQLMAAFKIQRELARNQQ